MGRYALGLIEHIPGHFGAHRRDAPGGGAGSDQFVVYVSSRRPDPPLRTGSATHIERLRRPSRAITLWDSFLWPRRFRRDAIDLFHSPFYGTPPRSRKAASSITPGSADSAQVALVTTIHDLIPILHPEAVTPRQRVVFRRTFESAFAAHRIIVPSNATRRDLIGAFPDIGEEKIEIVPLGLETIFHDELSRSRPAGPVELARVAAREQRFSEGRPYILNVGGFDPLKNVPALIEAFARLKSLAGPGTTGEIALVVCGEISGPRREALEKTIRQAGVSGDVFLPGRLEDSELVLAYAGAELFAFPSLSEGFGLPPLEAMACRCPVVSSSGGSLEEVLGDAALLVGTGSVAVPSEGARADFGERFALAMLSGLTDRSLRSRLVERGAARAAGLTWNEAARRTLEVYEDALVEAGAA